MTLATDHDHAPRRAKRRRRKFTSVTLHYPTVKLTDREAWCERQAHRRRKLTEQDRNGRTLDVVVNEMAAIDKLVRDGWIPERETGDDAKVNEAVKRMFAEFLRK